MMLESIWYFVLYGLISSVAISEVSGACLNDEECNQGTCNVASSLCVCNANWEGDNCSTAICSTVTCHNGGSCTAPNTCTCAYGWAGTNCSLPVCVNGCQNGGTCVGPDSCSCTAAWTGTTCSTPVCSLGCSNGGTCSNPEVCTCATGYMGEYCQTAICTNPYCNSTTSLCTAPDTCRCIAGFTGSNCSQYINPPLTDPRSYIPEFSLPNHGAYWLDWEINSNWQGSNVMPNRAVRLVPFTNPSQGWNASHGWIRSKQAFPLTEFTINATVEIVRYGNLSKGFAIYVISNATARSGFTDFGVSYIDPLTNFSGIMVEFKPAAGFIKLFASSTPRTAQSAINSSVFNHAATLNRYLNTRFRIGIVVRNGNTVSMVLCDIINCTTIFAPTSFPNLFPLGFPGVNTIIGMSASNLDTARASVDLIDLRVYSIANCTTDCGANGFCFKTGDFCACRAGWTGSDCLEPICDCANGGVCIWPGICRCPEGFAGDDCSKSQIGGFFSPRFCGRNFRLIQRDTFQRLTGPISTQQCADACWRAGSFKCRSFSYFANGTSSQCWLNVGHANEVWEGLEAAPGWQYYHAEAAREIAPCKNNTYHDCNVVDNLGLGPGNYTFQVDSGVTSFKAECIKVPENFIAASGTAADANELNSLWMVFHKRNRFDDINYANKTYQDFKWGFGSTTNTTNWVGLEWGYRLMSDFLLFTSTFTCVQLFDYNSTTQTLIIKNDSQLMNCAVFTHRQGNLAIATRSTCICKDPSSNLLVTCGCNTKQAVKFYFPLNQRGINMYVYEHYRQPWSNGNGRWVTSGISGTAITVTETSTPTTFISRPFRSRWVQMIQQTNGSFQSAWCSSCGIQEESKGYRLYSWANENINVAKIPLPAGDGRAAYNLAFVAKDRLQGYNNSLGGGYWMNVANLEQQICLTCTLHVSYYGWHNVSTGNVNATSYFLIRNQAGFP